MKSFVTFLLSAILLATVSTESYSLEIKLNAYVDSYYAWDNAKDYYSNISDHQKALLEDPNAQPTDPFFNRKYTFVNTTKDQFALNIAQISATAEAENFHSTITIHHGTLANTAIGEGMLQEAFVGYQLFEDFWLDAGYFLTHIGGELLTPKDNWLSSHSMATYFEPFFHSGLRASYKLSETLNLGVHLLNANASFEDNNRNKSLGFNAGFGTDFFGISYAGIYGNEADIGESQMHMYHNLCFNMDISDAFKVKAQVDYATLEDGLPAVELDEDPTDASFMAVSAQAKYDIVSEFNLAGRFTWFDNADGYGATPAVSGMEFTGGCEYKPTGNSYIRLEFGYLGFDQGDKIEGIGDIDDTYPGEDFMNNDNEPSSSRMTAAIHFGAWFDIMSAFKAKEE